MDDQETVRVRIAVMMNGAGEWAAEGWASACPDRVVQQLHEIFVDCDRYDQHTLVRWVEADLSKPTAEVVEGWAAE